MPRATISQVAELAGVSTATVSRALSDSRRVSATTRQRVQDAAQKLGYSGNSIASALRRNRTDTVGMVVPSITNPFFTSLVENVEHVLQEQGRQLFLCDSRQDAEVEARHLRSLLARQVDGIIISPCHDRHSGAAVQAAAKRIPLVQLDRQVSGTSTDWVGVDDHEAMRLLMEHLDERGARSAAFVTSTMTNSSTQLRLIGFRTQAQRLGIHTREEWIQLGDYSVAWGRAAGRRIMDDTPRPDAIVCADDLIAIGVLRACRDRSVAVPDDVQVTGYDDIDFADFVHPGLTTVRQPRERIAAEAVRLLAATAEWGGTAAHTALAPTLVIRGSTAQRARTGGV
ncbi:LacI family DNA-binding transcriptional regulator [Spiractinospora alimapuensis]|uniref:LacI family DNA-binding transcriptional regulator n=1 Tax=Spiractinospora alimapuensis TaxID=2820884 RepID=UPI001F41102E|nr:LacI family DNA-binding transcriptional regulator [Spiractinospora alimapuensis]QVQ51779.1 LacI family DNA-binding transcriptional regulator [Spiractinospora alimapuensis]